MKTQKLNSLSEWRKERDKLVAQLNFLERAAPNDFVKLTSLRMELIYAFGQIAVIHKQDGFPLDQEPIWPKSLREEKNDGNRRTTT